MASLHQFVPDLRKLFESVLGPLHKDLWKFEATKKYKNVNFLLNLKKMKWKYAHFKLFHYENLINLPLYKKLEPRKKEGFFR